MPRWATAVRLRLRSLFLGARVEGELQEELAYHFERGRSRGWALRVGVPGLWFGAAVLAKASGLVARLIERHQVRGLSVAPPA